MLTPHSATFMRVTKINIQCTHWRIRTTAEILLATLSNVMKLNGGLLAMCVVLGIDMHIQYTCLFVAGD